MIDIEKVKEALVKIRRLLIKDYQYLVDVNEQAITELERLQQFKKTFDRYELSKKQDFVAYEIMEEALKREEEMKTKVKRYFELKPDVTGFHKTDNFEDKWKEFHDLESELMKVSEENETNLCM